MSKKKNRYTKEYKAEAVKLVLKHGYSQAEAAESLGISSKNLSRWISDHEKPINAGDKLTTEKAELVRLRQENKRLKLERDILKKAAAFFANEST